MYVIHLSEFSGKRDRAVSTNERLELEAQAVLDVIENPDVAQALRQDKNQNLQYLKDNYNVCPHLPPPTACHLFTFHIAHPRTNHCIVQFWAIPIYIRQLQWCCRLPVSLPCTFD
jgi:hypothetical protein